MPPDSPALQRFFIPRYAVNAKDYTLAELDAWTDKAPDLKVWNRSFLEYDTLVAVMNGIIVGFGDMDETCYLDRLYVHHAYQGGGIATALCDRLEGRASAKRFVTHVSLMAKPCFEKRGYRVIKARQVAR